MKNFLIKQASKLVYFDNKFRISSDLVNEIAYKITKKAAIPRIVGQFGKVLSQGIKMNKKDMMNPKKVQERFIKLFNIYYDWVEKIKKEEIKTKNKTPLFTYFAKIFDEQINKFVDELTVPEEEGGPGWGRLGVNNIVNQAAYHSKMNKIKNKLPWEKKKRKKSVF